MSVRRGLRTFATREFAAYMVVVVPAFVVGGWLAAAYLSPLWAYAAGFALATPVELVRDRLQQRMQDGDTE